MKEKTNIEETKQPKLNRVFVFMIAVVIGLIAALICCVSSMNKMRDEMRAEIESAHTQIEQLEETIDIYEEDLDEYRNLLEAETDTNAQLTVVVDELEKEAEALRNELDTLKAEHENCRPPITFSADNVLMPSNVTTEELAGSLYHALGNYAKYFVAAEKKYGVNAIFLASIAALESGWGRSDLAVNNNNIFGYKNANGVGFRKYDTIEDCVEAIAKHLRNNYLTEGGRHYNGVSVEAVNVKYCGSKTWAPNVTRIANAIVERIKNA